MAQMRTSSPDESQLMFLVFDLLHQDGVDLRGLPLSERRRDLERLSRKARVPLSQAGRDIPRWGGPVRSLQSVRVRGYRQQATELALLERTKPELGEGEVPAMEAHQY
jgi:hypothetical protein